MELIMIEVFRVVGGLEDETTIESRERSSRGE